jgi:hypothetical protein
MRNRTRDSDYEIITDMRGRKVRILRDGRTYRAGSVRMMDSNRRSDITGITDGAGGSGYGLHRPGFRIPASDAGQQGTIAAARQRYEDTLTNAWKGDAVGEGPEGSVCTVRNAKYPDDQGAPGHIKNGVCVPDNPRGKSDADVSAYKSRKRPDDDDDDDDDEDVESQTSDRRRRAPRPDDDDDDERYKENEDEIVGNAATHTESGRDSRSVNQIVRDHQANMARIYADHDRKLSEVWRRP